MPNTIPCVSRSVEPQTMEAVPPAMQFKLSALTRPHLPEQWFLHIQRLHIATSVFQQDVSLLCTKDSYCSSSGGNICKDIYAVSFQYPGPSNFVGYSCLFIFIAFSCYHTFRGLITDFFSCPGHIASSYSSSHKLTTKISHTSPFFSWWNIFPLPIVQETCTFVLLPAQNFFLPFTLCNYLSQAALSSAATLGDENLTKHHWMTAYSNMKNSKMWDMPLYAVLSAHLPLVSTS